MRRDHEGDEVVEVHTRALGSFGDVLAVYLGGKTGVFELFLDGADFHANILFGTDQTAGVNKT